MSGELEATGAMATAGLVAGALEGRETHGHGGGACLNCGAALAGPYCSQCGQAAHAHRTLSHLFEEVLHGLVHFDTKAWRTLPMLIGRPGSLTRNYIYGKRACYISPLALFLFTVFFMFFVFAFVDVDLLNVNTTANVEEARAELAEAREALAAAESRLAQARTEPSDRMRLAQRAVDLAQAEVERREAALARAQTPPIVIDRPTSATAEPAGAGEPPSPASGAPEVAGEERWQDVVSTAAKNGEITVGSPFPELNERILHSLENPDLALYKTQQAAYKFSFLLVPISLPFIWLMFLWKRGLTLYDHAVFTLYSLSFASLAFVVMATVNDVPWIEWLGSLVLLAMPVHMFFHLKGTYALGWVSALWRTMFLLLFAVFSLSVFVGIIMLLGLGG